MVRRMLFQKSALLAAGPAALAAACGPAGAGGGDTAQQALPPRPVDIQLWTRGPSEDAVKAQLAGWMQQQPNVRVELVYDKEVFDLKGTEALIAMMAAGDPPHVVKWNRPVTGSAVVKNMLTAIDDFAKRDKVDVKARFYAAGLAEMTGPLDGKLYGLTYDMDNRLLFWNKAAFRLGGLGSQPPREFAEFRDMAVRFTRRGADGLEQLGFMATFGTELLYQWALANGGGQYLSPDGKKVTLDAAKNVEALDFLAKLVQAQGAWDAQAAFTSRFAGVRGVSATVNAFVNNKLAMYAATNLNVPSVYSARPETEFDVAAMPTARRSDPPVTWAGGFAWAIPAGVKHPAAAWELLKYLVSEPALAARTEGDRGRLAAAGQPFFYGISVGQPAIDEALLKRFLPPAEMRPLVQRGLDQMKTAKNRPVSPAIAELWQAQKDATAEAVQGKKSAQAALQEATRKVQVELDAFWAGQKR
ncbi:MAG: extracellular solute-binding protein [Chloroflexi bacterium]|nr:extracellular solute-binding protein [Chloroflexota bacterium]